MAVSPLFTVQLANAATDALIDSNLVDGEVVSLTEAELQSLALVADPEDSSVKSVRMQLSGPVTSTKLESIAPFASFGDISGDLKGKELPEGTYTLTLTGYDAKKGGGSVVGSQTIEFTLDAESGSGGGTGGGSDQNAPTVEAKAKINVAENSTGVFHTVDGDDADGDALSYAITGGNDAEFFSINASTGALRFKDAPDFENPADSNGDNLYRVRVSVSDGVSPAAEQLVVAKVTDVDEDGSGGGGGGGEGPSDGGYYKGVQGSDGFYFKIQFEDANGPAPAGEAAPGRWSVHTKADSDGNQAGFKGDGYLLYGNENSTSIGGVRDADILEYKIYVPAGKTGKYQLLPTVSRDGEHEGDKQNDFWVAVTDENGDHLDVGRAGAHPVSKDHVKLYGGPNNGSWGDALRIDGGGPAYITFPEEGVYTVSFAGRSDGFHIDQFRIFEVNSDPGANAKDSSYVSDGTSATSAAAVVEPVDASSDDDLFDFAVTRVSDGALVDANLEDGDVIARPADKFQFTGTFEAGVEAASVQMDLFDAAGQLVKSKSDAAEPFTFQLDTAKSAPGDYTLRLQTFDQADAQGEATGQQLIEFSFEDSLF